MLNRFAVGKAAVGAAEVFGFYAVAVKPQADVAAGNLRMVDKDIRAAAASDDDVAPCGKNDVASAAETGQCQAATVCAAAVNAGGGRVGLRSCDAAQKLRIDGLIGTGADLGAQAFEIQDNGNAHADAKQQQEVNPFGLLCRACFRRTQAAAADLLVGHVFFFQHGNQLFVADGQHGVLLLDVSCVIGADDLSALVHQRAAAVAARNRGVVFPHG